MVPFFVIKPLSYCHIQTVLTLAPLQINKQLQIPTHGPHPCKNVRWIIDFSKNKHNTMNSTLFKQCIHVVNTFIVWQFQNVFVRAYSHSPKSWQFICKVTKFFHRKKNDVKLQEISQSTPRGGRDHCAPKNNHAIRCGQTAVEHPQTSKMGKNKHD